MPYPAAAAAALLHAQRCSAPALRPHRIRRLRALLRVRADPPRHDDRGADRGGLPRGVCGARGLRAHGAAAQRHIPVRRGLRARAPLNQITLDNMHIFLPTKWDNHKLVTGG